MWDLLHLFAVATLRGDSAFVARHTVVVVFVGDEGLGTDRLLTAVTSKTVLVPRGTVILQHPRSCQRGRRRQINVCDCLLISHWHLKSRVSLSLISVLLCGNYKPQKKSDSVHVDDFEDQKWWFSLTAQPVLTQPSWSIQLCQLILHLNNLTSCSKATTYTWLHARFSQRHMLHFRGL